MPERHVITIGKDGTPTIEVEGVKGSSCKAATEQIERLLGNTVSDLETPEYFEGETCEVKH
jgi:hypothetical protein